MEKDSAALLLKAAKKIFAEHGYDGATVKQIADRAGVNISLVSYHFDGKEGLYRACFEDLGKNRLEAAERFLTPPASAEEFRVRLGLFSDDFLLWGVVEPEVTSIMHRECMSKMSLTKDIFQKTFMKSFTMLSDFFESSKKKNILRGDIDSFATAGFFFGSLIHISRSQQMMKEEFGLSLEDSKYRQKLVDEAVRNLMYGVMKPQKS